MTAENVGKTPTKYKPIAELGRGGMATVFLALVQGPAGFNKLQVIKRLRPALAADPEFLQMFLEEARLAARINHPNVVQTNEVGFDGHYYFIAMEYLDGQTLEAVNRKLHKTGNTLPLGMHLHILAETLAGLHYAHELTDFDGSPLNVVHRDVSPHNAMVGYDGHVKILDFGIAKAADSSSDTRTGIMKGKCAYMAPEQFGGMTVDRRADLFAVGVMLWQALTGRRLWKGLSDADIFAHLSRGEIPTPRSLKPDVPEELERICMRALSPRPEERFGNAAEFESAIENYLSAAQIRVTSRELGKYLSELFADNRTAIKAAIEAQVSTSPAAADIHAAMDARTSTDVPLLWSLLPNSVSDSGGLAPAQGAEQSQSKAHLTREIAGARRRARLSILAGVGIAAVTVAVYAATRRSPETAQANVHATPPPLLSAPAPAAPTAPAQVRLTVRATPKEARLFLDDAPLDGNPAIGTFTKDGATHNVRAEASGYVTKRDLTVFDTSTVTIDLALDREKPKPVAWWPPPASHTTVSAPPPDPPPPTPQPATAAPPTPPPAPTKQGPALDTSDPWAPSTPKPKT
jgi:serine/threonine protein kinase